MKMKSTTQLGFLCFGMLSIAFSTAQGVSVLTNGSFEVSSPASGYGNNIGVTVSDWALVAAGGSTNIILPLGSYSDGPNDAQDGVQYLDIADAAGYYTQTITLTAGGTLEFGAYFSRRAAPGGGSVSIYDSTNSTFFASSSVVFNDLSVTEEVWTLSSGSAALAAGTYVLRVNIDDSANADSAFAIIPEPAVGALSLLGFLALARRRRQGN